MTITIGKTFLRGEKSAPPSEEILDDPDNNEVQIDNEDKNEIDHDTADDRSPRP